MQSAQAYGLDHGGELFGQGRKEPQHDRQGDDDGIGDPQSAQTLDELGRGRRPHQVHAHRECRDEVAHEEADRPCRPPHRPAQDLRAQDLSPPAEGEEQDLGAQSAPGADRGEQDRHGYERD